MVYLSKRFLLLFAGFFLALVACGSGPPTETPAENEPPPAATDEDPNPPDIPDATAGIIRAPANPSDCNSSDDFDDTAALENCWYVFDNGDTNTFVVDAENSLLVMAEPVSPTLQFPLIWKETTSENLTITLRVTDMAESPTGGIYLILENAGFGDAADSGFVLFEIYNSGECVVRSSGDYDYPAFKSDCIADRSYPIDLKIEKRDSIYNFYYKTSAMTDFFLMNNGMSEAGSLNHGPDFNGPHFPGRYHIYIEAVWMDDSDPFHVELDGLTFEEGTAADQH